MLHSRSTRRIFTHLLLISLCVLAGFWWLTYNSWHPASTSANGHPTRHGIKTHHPLDDAINEARKFHENRISHRITNLHDASHAYRQRRGRHPPPGFEKWYARAVASQAVIVESFFDQIYEDLEPFWGLEPTAIRGALEDWQWKLRIKNGKIKDIPQGRFRSRVWGEMINKVAGDLPDMDIAINPLDEPRVFVPFSRIDKLVRAASQQRDRMMSLPAGQILNRPTKWTPVTPDSASKHKWFKKGELWPHVLETCPPANSQQPNGTDQNIPTYTTNWTTTKEICANHHWANLHGSLLKPATMDISTDLLPIFSAAKLQGSNDILLPPPAYYTNDFLFTGKSWFFGDGKTSTPWHKKLHGLVWRGKATGGLIHESTVEKSHRQRLVSMLNASNVPAILNDNDSDLSLHPAELPTTDPTTLAAWLRTTANAAFTDTMCPAKATSPACASMSTHFSTAPSLPMKQQYNTKYLPDIDGNSLSGRFRAFLLSNSCPLKSTIFKEWHDARLTPWVHFVPVDITLRDLWGTMAYFLGVEGSQARDWEGERIAEEGRLWSEKVLRREDMEVYVQRVLMEFGRVGDEDRDWRGFTEDLKDG